jgi:RHS repeat-associated protein
MSRFALAASAALVAILAACDGGDAPPDVAALGRAATTRDGEVRSVSVGSLPGSFAVDDRGAATYAVPVEVPPGRAGLEPALSLVYDSLAGNGALGVGWAIAGISRIEECDVPLRLEPVDGMSEYCLDGAHLVRVGEGELGVEYRTYPDRTDRVLGSTTSDRFTVERRDGRVAVYDREDDLGVWMLRSLSDRSQNRIEYQWYAPDLPSHISYNILGSGDQAVAHTVIDFFADESRPDPFVGFEAGALRSRPQRLRRIEVRSGGELVRDYRLTYTEGGDATGFQGTGRSRLASIAHCDGAGVCLPATTFGWQVGNAGFDLFPGPADDYNGPSLVLDIDGNGADDLAWCWGPVDEDRHWTYVLATPGAVSVFGPTQYTDIGCFSDEWAIASDTNLDGYDDIVTHSKSYSLYSVIHGGADGIADAVDWSPPHGDLIRFFTLADVDGDGTNDLVACEGEGYWDERQQFDPPWFPDRATRWVWYPNHGHQDGFGDRQPTGDECEGMSVVADRDGDGDLEILFRDRVGEEIVYGLTGSGTIEVVGSSFPGRGTVAAADFNGDGHYDLYDAVGFGETESVNRKIYLSDGRGAWLDAGTSTFPDLGWFEAHIAKNGRVLDYDGDGLADMLYPEDPWWHIRRTSFQGSGGSASFDEANSATTAMYESSLGVTTAAAIGDFNGDGRPDLIQRAVKMSGPDVLYQSSTVYLHRGAAYNGVPIRGHADLIRAIVDGHGKRIEVTYAPMTDPDVYTPERTSCGYERRCVLDARPLVREYTSNGEPATVYSYEGLQADGIGRRELGFARRRILRYRAGITDTWETLIESDDYTYDANRRVYPFAGQVRRQTTRVPLPGNRKVYLQTLTDPDLYAGSHARTYFTATSSTTSAVYEWVEPDFIPLAERARTLSAETPLSSQTDWYTWDAYHGVTQAGRSTSDPGESAVVDTPRDNRVSSWLIGLPLSQTTVSLTAGGSQVRHTELDHDSRGLLREVIRQPSDPALKLTTTIDWDTQGNATEISEADGEGNRRTTQMLYDPATHVLPVYVVDPLGHETWIDYRDGLGVPTHIVDEAGVATSYVLDGFGRVRARDRSANGVSSGEKITVGYERILPLGPTPMRLRWQTLGRPEEVVDLDSGGRPVRREWDGYGFRSFQVYEYDVQHRLYSISVPVEVGDPAADFTTYQYDNLDRLRFHHAPDTTTIERAYQGNRMWVKNPRGYTTWADVDGHGRVIRSFDELGTATCFVYGPFGAVVRVTKNCESGAPPTTTVMHVDAFGRTIDMEDEALGRRTWTYDAFGDLVQEEDANRQRTRYTYDARGRRTSRVDDDGTTTWTWDVSRPGALHQASSPDGVVDTYRYDDFGRITGVRTDIDGDSYGYTATYDLFGRLDTLGYPVGASLPPFKVRYLYDPFGHPVQVKDAITGAFYWKALAADSSGRIIEEQFGNGVETERGFDIMGRTQTIDTFLPPASGGWLTLQDLLYDHDVNGNVKARHDGTVNQLELFEYDELDRLTEVTTRPDGPVPPLVNSATYDVYGNFTSRTGIGAYSAMPGGRVLSAGRNNYYYDHNGDLTLRSDGLEIDYTPFRRPETITAPDGETIDYRYSAAWRAVRRHSSTDGVTLMIGGLYERRLPPGVTDPRVDSYLVRANGRTVARVERFIDLGASVPCPPPPQSCPPPEVTEEVVYLHDDQEGSIDVVSGADGGIVQRVSFDAWGKPRDPDWGVVGSFDQELEVNVGYTGHAGALDAGLINMGGRMYDPVIARHTGPDPFVPAPVFSQSHNRYSYVLNNPLTHVDPTGYCLDNLGCGDGGGVVLPGLFGLLFGLVQLGMNLDDPGGEQTASQQHQTTRASSNGRHGGGRPERVSTHFVTTDSVLLNAGPTVADDEVAVAAIEQSTADQALAGAMDLGDLWTEGRDEFVSMVRGSAVGRLWADGVGGVSASLYQCDMLACPLDAYDAVTPGLVDRTSTTFQTTKKTTDVVQVFVAVGSLANGVAKGLWGTDKVPKVIGNLAGPELEKRVADVTARLQGHVDDAVAHVRSLGDEALTEGQRKWAKYIPGLRTAFTGERIDHFTRAFKAADDGLADVVSNRAKGPDFIDTLTGHWMDVTTKNAWYRHMKDYYRRGFGENGHLLEWTKWW